jgi:hypothetical protein
MRKKTIPAVWFQKNLDPVKTLIKKPAVLELLESELAQVTGGGCSLTSPGCCADDSCQC